MTHVTNDGDPKIRTKNAPILHGGKEVVKAYSNRPCGHAVIPEGLVLKELVSGMTTDDIQSITEPKLIISPDLKELQL